MTYNAKIKLIIKVIKKKQINLIIKHLIISDDSFSIFSLSLIFFIFNISFSDKERFLKIKLIIVGMTIE